MRITLIGMSGSGKSLWSTVLSKHGFQYLGCDNEIGRRLVDDGELPEGSLDLIGRWMLPTDVRFRVREAPWILFGISIVVNVGMWLERYVIVITLHRDYLPSSWGTYSPTVWAVFPPSALPCSPPCLRRWCTTVATTFTKRC
jgi:hypothetical protein